MKTFANTPTIKTNRLILRKFTKNDIQALFEIFSDEIVNTYLPWFVLKTLNEAKIFFKEKYIEAYKHPNTYKYAICLKSNNIPIGYVNISNDDSHDLGYGLKKEYWNQGIVTEACKAVVTILKKSDIPYITATHDINNPRSGSIMKNIGMTYCYSFEEQWQPKNKLVIFKMYQLNLDEQNHKIYKKYWNNSITHFV